METNSERDLQKYMTVLEDVLAKCQNLLNHRSVQEADLREALSLLKLAHSDAERGLVGVEREDWHRLRAQTVTTVAMLLRPLRGFNPDLTTWERARDPSVPVQGRNTRSRSIRTFDYPRAQAIYEEIRKRIWEKLPSIRPPAPRQGPWEEMRPRDGENRERNQEPLREHRGDGTRSEPLRTDAQSRPRDPAGFPGPLPDAGPPGGQFLMATSDQDTSGWSENGRGPRKGLKRARKKSEIRPSG